MARLNAPVDPLRVRLDRFLELQSNGCLLFTGCVQSRGYGSLGDGVRTVLAHKLAWETTNGKVPEGFRLLHMCHEKLCCEPEHMRLLARSEHGRRSMEFITHCARGHLRTPLTSETRKNGRVRCICCSRVEKLMQAGRGRREATRVARERYPELFAASEIKTALRIAKRIRRKNHGVATTQ